MRKARVEGFGPFGVVRTAPDKPVLCIVDLGPSVCRFGCPAEEPAPQETGASSRWSRGERSCGVPPGRRRLLPVVVMDAALKPAFEGLLTEMEKSPGRDRGKGLGRVE
ncbi:hypothetical protein IscW_ISCW022278 [Ixodes scapularis]|uniref:Uncharacterized protein n=1 Tax=Ixodes scapularis TaxID=6945 RepID=B7QEF9_IXOSC|nr:hypothetical protein IscW_ISCW022278 [Ixodes scapularis]|eukprot:XP_002413933.1 hypothetical protein IscW_ISCW022278 [Ixodes scapularis]